MIKLGDLIRIRLRLRSCIETPYVQALCSSQCYQARGKTLINGHWARAFVDGGPRLYLSQSEGRLEVDLEKDDRAGRHSHQECTILARHKRMESAKN